MGLYDALLLYVPISPIIVRMSTGRPLEFDPDTALESAMHLFWRKGYELSSLQDLLSTMGLSKSSFYQTFKSKHELFQNCIRHYRKMLADDMSTQMEQTDSGKVFIETLFCNVADETAGPNSRRGCLLMNTANEFAQRDPEIAKLVSRSIEEFTDLFEKAVQQSQRQGEIPPDKDTRALAIYLVSSMSGLRNIVKAGADRETVKRIVKLILSTLN